MSFIRKARHLSRRDLYVGPLIPALLVFGALLVIIGLSWRTARQDVDTQYTTTVSQIASGVEDTLTQRLGIYEDTLRSGAGLFSGSDNVTAGEWNSFISSLKLPARFPGIRSVGYAKVIYAEDKTAFIDSIRNMGAQGFDITPAGTRDRYASVAYIVPLSKDISPAILSATLGYDMYSEPVRNQALEAAQTTGEPVLSDKVNLDTSGDSNLFGFILFMPVYKKAMPLDTSAERVQAIDGFTYASFATTTFFTTLFKTNNPDITFAIADESGSDTVILYKSSDAYDSPTFGEARRSVLSLYGQVWSITYKTRPEIVASSMRTRPWSVAYGGTVFAFVTAMMVYLLIQRRTSLLAFAEQRRLEEAKDELLSLASHQLRTPATAVKQYISMVIGGFAGKLSKEQSKLLEMAYDSNERQLTIVDDLLYVARLDAGQASMAYERFDLHELLRSVIDDQHSLINERHQTVRLHAPKRKIYLEGDPKYIRMTLENLLSNASKYSREGKKIEIYVRTTEDKAFVTFTDQGVGIKEEDYENVFKKFSRIPNELTRQTAGSGIGLYLARQLTRLHGGDITLLSSLKTGSSFTVILPLIQGM